MRDFSARRWLGWRLTPFTPPAPAPVVLAGRFTRYPLAPEPASDGDIRHDLVARVRQEIAAGLYDLDGEKWAAAEERLLSRLEGGS